MENKVVSHTALIDLLDKYYGNIDFTTACVETCFKDKYDRKWYAYKDFTGTWYILPYYFKLKTKYTLKEFKKYMLVKTEGLLSVPLVYYEEDLPKLDEPVRCNFFGCGKKCKTRKNKKGHKKYVKYTKKYRKRNKQF
jgi:hypothetical protein